MNLEYYDEIDFDLEVAERVLAGEHFLFDICFTWSETIEDANYWCDLDLWLSSYDPSKHVLNSRPEWKRFLEMVEEYKKLKDCPVEVTVASTSVVEELHRLAARVEKLEKSLENQTFEKFECSGTWFAPKKSTDFRIGDTVWRERGNKQPVECCVRDIGESFLVVTSHFCERVDPSEYFVVEKSKCWKYETVQNSSVPCYGAGGSGAKFAC